MSTTDLEVTETETAPCDSFDVRRNVGISAVLGVAATAMMVAYVVRVLGGGTWLDWFILAVMSAMAAAYLSAVADARAPLLVVDRQGVRVREGRRWSGVAWSEVDMVEHLPRRGLLRDGFILVARRDQDDDLTVPLSLSTRVVGLGGADLSTTLAELSAGSTEVVEIDPSIGTGDEWWEDGTGSAAAEHQVPEQPQEPTAAESSAAEDDAEDDAEDEHQPEQEPEAGDGPGAGPGEVDRAETQPDPAAPVEPAPLVATPTPLPLRDPRHGVRAELERDATAGATALRLDPDSSPRRQELPEADALRRGDDDPLGWAEPAPTVVIDQPAVAPAPEPVIGPELAAARIRLGLGVDQLAERTRIRPHVIESIELDDFAPCGGDFYARGHLRTLARVLAVDAAPLLRSYDERYADAPIDARRVFEAELATAGGSIRSTHGGPSWSVLVAAVMAVILVWSVVRLVMDSTEAVTPPSPFADGSGGPKGNGVAGGAADPVPVTLTAAGGGARVVVRDADGEIAYDGQLSFGQSVSVEAAPPVRVSTTDGSLEVTIDGEDRGPLGATGQQGQNTYVVR